MTKRTAIKHYRVTATLSIETPCNKALNNVKHQMYKIAVARVPRARAARVVVAQSLRLNGGSGLFYKSTFVLLYDRNNQILWDSTF